MTAGERVRALRNQKGWTQTELGRRLGVSQNTVSGIENNSYRDEVKPSTLEPYAAMLGVTVRYLLYGDVNEPEQGSSSAQQDAANRTGKLPSNFLSEIAELEDGLLPEDQQTLINLARRLYQGDRELARSLASSADRIISALSEQRQREDTFDQANAEEITVEDTMRETKTESDNLRLIEPDETGRKRI